MEQFRWTKQELKREFSEAKSLAELIEQVENKFWNQKKVVCEIYINDQKIDEENTDSIPISDLSEVVEFKITAAKINKLIKDNLSTLCRWLKKEIGSVEIIMRAISQNKLSKAQKEFIVLIDGMGFLSSNLSLLKGFLACESFFAKDLAEWEKIEFDFKTIVEEVTQAIESSDYLFMAEIIQDDYIENLNNWLEILSRLEDNYM